MTHLGENDWFGFQQTIKSIIFSLTEGRGSLSEDLESKYFRDLAQMALFLENTLRSPLQRNQHIKECVISLHDCLLLIYPRFAENARAHQSLNDCISIVCELYWLQGEVECEKVIVQLVPFMLISTNSADFSTEKVMRLWFMRKALTLLDFEDTDIEFIRTLLVDCIPKYLFLNTSEGVRFLGYLFSLDRGTKSKNK